MLLHKRDFSLPQIHNDIKNITSPFVFDHHPSVQEDGLMVSPQGFARAVYHRPTDCMLVLFSKTADSLMPEVDGDGKAHLTEKQGHRVYLFAAQRLEGRAQKLNGENIRFTERENGHAVKRVLRDGLDKKRRKLGERSRDHLTLRDFGHVLTIGRHVYEIKKTRYGYYDVSLHLSTRRKYGGFVPFDLDDKSFRGVFSRATASIATTRSYDFARRAVFEHWDHILSPALWEHKDVFKECGEVFRAKHMLTQAGDVIEKKGMKVALTTSAVGVGFGVFKYAESMGIQAAILAGVTGAVIHTASDLSAEFVYERGEKATKRMRAAQKRKHIDAYACNQDVSDHFMVQTSENMARLCPHIDLDRFNMNDFELPSREEFDLRKDGEPKSSGLQSQSLAGHVMFQGQRGYSSTGGILNRTTEVKGFQDGVSRLMHRKNDKKIVAYAQYQEHLVANDDLKLPDYYRDQFKGGILRIEYDRDPLHFSDRVLHCESVSYREMMDEYNKSFLPASQKYMPQPVKDQSENALRDRFIDATYQEEEVKDNMIIPDAPASASMKRYEYGSLY